MYLDVYVLVPTRSNQAIAAFAESFLSGMTEAAEEYVFPQFSDNPGFSTSDVSEVIRRVLADTTAEYSLYWSGLGIASSTAAMMFFTADGGLIVGLTVPEAQIAYAKAELSKTMRSTCSLVLFEQPPPDTALEFANMASVGGAL